MPPPRIYRFEMPFTPFHLGLGLGLGLPLRRYLHTPTFLLANIIVDVEPLLVLLLGLRYPLHGYLHTFLSAIPLGFILGYIMLLFENPLKPVYRKLLLEDGKLELKSFTAAGCLGTGLHILLDAPLYTDIKPFYPAAFNPLYNPSLTPVVYGVCVWVGLLGLLYYVWIALSPRRR